MINKAKQQEDKEWVVRRGDTKSCEMEMNMGKNTLNIYGPLSSEINK